MNKNSRKFRVLLNRKVENLSHLNGHKSFPVEPSLCRHSLDGHIHNKEKKFRGHPFLRPISEVLLCEHTRHLWTGFISDKLSASSILLTNVVCLGR